MRLYIIAVLMIVAILPGGSLPFSRSGVLDSPDAYILHHTEIEIELAGAAYTVQDSLGNGDNDFIVTGHLDIGLFNYCQIGISYLGEGGVSGSIKAAILSESVNVPAFAIGLENISTVENIDHFKNPDGSYYGYDHAQNWSAYGVASKDLRYLLGFPATVSLGIGIGRFVGVIENGALGIGSKISHGLFGSLVYHPSEEFSVIMEQDGRDLNLGFTYELSRHFTMQIAWAEFEQTVFPAENQNKTDVMQNSKFTIGVRSIFGPLIGAGRLELEQEQQRIQRSRERLAELEARRRAAEAELQRLRDLLEERR